MNRGQVLELIHDETGSRFEQILEELRREREDQNRKWEENRSITNQLLQSIEEHNHKWEKNQAVTDQLLQSIEEHNRKWEKNQAVTDQLLLSIRDLNRKHEGSIGALGARWGLHSEQSFRNALKGILDDSFGIEVFTITEYDEAGEVFGHPDQIELDLIIKNGDLILCEIKSSMSKSDLYAFHRKVQFYQKHHGRQATRRIVISPMIDKRAQKVAQELGIETYSYAEDVALDSTPM